MTSKGGGQVQVLDYIVDIRNPILQGRRRYMPVNEVRDDGQTLPNSSSPCAVREISPP
jgi:hypothetical protein